jgi:hypothetical protein
MSPLELSIHSPCTPEERWEKPASFAIKRPNRKNAVRVLDTQEKAEEYLLNKGKPGDTIEIRPGESPRCLYYCDVKEWCHQWKANKHLYGG